MRNKLQKYRDGCKTFDEVAENLYNMANTATLFASFCHGKRENVAWFVRRELMPEQREAFIIEKLSGYKRCCDMKKLMRAGKFGVPVYVAEGGHFDAALSMGTIQALIGTKPI